MLPVRVRGSDGCWCWWNRNEGNTQAGRSRAEMNRSNVGLGAGTGRMDLPGVKPISPSDGVSRRRGLLSLNASLGTVSAGDSGEELTWVVCVCGVVEG